MVIVTILLHHDPSAGGLSDSDAEVEFGDTFLHYEGNWSFDHLNDIEFVV